MNCLNSFSCSWCYNFCTLNSLKALRMLAYFNSAMLWMYQIDSYALDLLAYLNSSMLWMYQIDSYALDLLAYTLILLCFECGPISSFNSDGHIRKLGIASQWVYNVVHPICYIFMSRWIRNTCLNSSSSIDWLWIWWMDFVAPSLFWINCC
jgi:hypothetical protein